MIDKVIIENKKPKYNKNIIFILLTSLLIIGILCFNIKTYSTYKLIGYIECENECYINISLPYNKINLISDNTLLEIDNKKIAIDDYEYGDITLENEIPYQNIKIKTNIEEDKIIEIKILNNKQRISEKIYEIIKEG